jgi:hypothetical protein
MGAGCKDDCERVFDRTIDCLQELGANETIIKDHKKQKESFIELCRSTDVNKKLAARCLKKKTCRDFVTCNQGRDR